MTRGRKNPDKPPASNLLPPCKVCGESATGFHYGVTTCTACKGFFRRSLVRTGPYICLQNQLCHVGPSTKRRDSCPKCRYEKCIGVGMSITGIKVGRYSRVNKSKYKAEYLDHELQQSPSSSEDTFHVDKKEEEPMMMHDEPMDESDGNLHDSMQDCKIMRENSVTSSDDCDDLPVARNDSYSSIYGNMYDDDDFEISTSILTSFIGAAKGQLEDLCCSELINRPISSHEFDYDNDDSRDIQSRFTSSPKTTFEKYSASSPNSVNDPHLQNNKPVNDSYMKYYSQDDVKPIPVIQDVFQRNESVYSNPPISNRSPSTRQRVSDSYSHFFHQNTIRLDNHTSPKHQSQHAQPSPDCHMPDYSSSCEYSIPHHDTSTSPVNRYTSIDNSEKFDCKPIFYNNQSRREEILDLSLKPLTSVKTEPNVYSSEYNRMKISVKNDPTMFSTDNNRIKPSVEHDSRTYSHESIKLPKSMKNYSAVYSCEKDRLQYDSFPMSDLTSRIIKTNPVPKGSIVSHNKENRKFFSNGLKRRITGSDDIIYVVDDDEVRDAGKFAAKRQRCDYSKAKANFSTGGVEKKQKKCQEKGNISSGRISKLLAALHSDLKPSFLLYKTPDIIPYALSVFDRFPFKCFESNGTSSLMKDLYEIDDNIRELLLAPYRSRISQQRSLDSDRPTIVDWDEDISFETDCEKYWPVAEWAYNSNDMDQLFNFILSGHDQHFGHKSTYMTKSDLQAANETFWGICQLHDLVQGKISFIDDDKYFKILDETGIDMDRRQQYVLTYLELMDTLFVKDVKYFRTVPGYSHLKNKDKMTLLRSCSILYSLIIAFRGMDEEHHVCLNEENGWANRMGTFSLMFPPMANVMTKVKRLMGQMVSMDLSHEEMVIFKVLMLTAPYPHNDLDEPELISEIYQMYHKCLLSQLRKQYDPVAAGRRFGRIIGVLERLNSLRALTWDMQIETTPKLRRLIQGHQLPLIQELYCHDGMQN